jgi:hypothetical protein
MTLIDRTVIANEIANPEIKRLERPIKVRGIGSRRHPTSEFIVVNVYLTGEVQGKHIQRTKQSASQVRPAKDRTLQSGRSAQKRVRIGLITHLGHTPGNLHRASGASPSG